ncbi:(3S,6E)-nerolidol synthase 1-like [Momordica charantia]|uniref:(3S,6E)-nerolidol synthase 1-like n=1 Tax=Momordica charantia TaxID=3673 RepID=A0A6J1CEY3_MOMCH|nr:(3S,6E)-nerolidol synthase 1-like [Momordica charantia]
MSETRSPALHFAALVSSSFSLSKNSADDLMGSALNSCDVRADLEHLLPITEIGEDPSLETLDLVDAAQRLGVDYRFQTEIDLILESHYAIANSPGDDLHQVALRFRLLRQRGYFVSSDVFKIFMDEEGNFKQGLEQDIKGLMSLYEASQLCILGEDILEQAANFSAQILEQYVKNNLNTNQARDVAKTLANPFHTSFSKFMVKDYLGTEHHSQATNRWAHAFQQVAKMDFNAAQNMHRQELLQFTRWWRETGLGKVMKFARDQPLKWYVCSLVCLMGPRFSEERVELSKPISFVYLIDDMFDLYGSLHQLTVFTEAVKRWDVATAETLPECMKICFKSLYEMTNQLSCKIHQKHGWDPIDSLRKSWAKLCDAFLLEAGWFTSGKSPSAEEYLRNGVISSGVHVVLVHVFFLLGQGINKRTVQLLDSNPEIISSAATILRLQDDFGSAKDENQDGYDGSYVNYYMTDNQEVSIESTRKHITNLISCAWKTLNRESLLPNNPFPLAFVEASLNIARFVPVLYGYDENQNLPTLEKLVKSMLYETVQM